jgi:predicted Zn-dependent protease
MFSHLLLLAVLLALPLQADRTKLKPGFNIFSVAQDIELGLRASKEMEVQMEILRNFRANNYLDTLGKRLAAKAPGREHYRFQFKIVNDKSINAAGLPGGIVYVNRGTIEAADNEAQLAGVIAHEIGHIVLRHGTHQISNAYVLQAPLSTMGVIGSQSVTAVLAKLGGGFTASSIVLRNPLEAESEADLLGMQIIYDSGYDPKAAAKFFEKLDVKDKNSKAAQFLGDHPSPANRIANVTKEIERLGDVSSNGLVDSPEYQSIRLSVSSSSEPQHAPAAPRR